MGYSDDPNHCRADFFTDSGKWKYTDVLDFDGLFYGTCGGVQGDLFECRLAPHPKGMWLADACIKAWLNLGRYRDLTMVVLKPKHEHKHPQAMKMTDAGLWAPAWTRSE